MPNVFSVCGTIFTAEVQAVEDAVQHVQKINF